jgi:alpha-1,6-mannosyltransferase
MVIDGAARRCLLLGLGGTSAMAVAATAVGAVPVEGLGGWAWPWPPGRPWPAVALAYLGIALLVAAWWRMPRATAGLRRRRLAFTLTAPAVWSVPLLLAPPLYSRDVYSYLAQGVMYGEGLDPYRLGPAALGGPLADNVSAMWQNAPAPYGPAFLTVASAVTTATGPRVVPGVIGMRAAMLAALVVAAACTVVLARLTGVVPADAVWLGIANPLMLVHVVSGAHNDVLIVALMSAGLLLAARGRPLTAAVLLGLGVLVKAPAGLALLAVVPAMALRLPGRLRTARATALVGATAAVTVLAVTWLTGTWYGWVAALGDTARVRNGLSLSTDLGVVAAQLLGVSDPGEDVGPVTVLRVAGLVGAAVLTGWIVRRYRDRPVHAVGLVLVGVVLLAPVVHPWYLLWGLVPLAASTRDPVLRSALAGLSAALALYPMPWGEGFTDQLPVGAGGLAAGLLLAWLVLRDRRSIADGAPKAPTDGDRAGRLAPALATTGRGSHATAGQDSHAATGRDSHATAGQDSHAATGREQLAAAGANRPPGQATNG